MPQRPACELVPRSGHWWSSRHWRRCCPSATSPDHQVHHQVHHRELFVIVDQGIRELNPRCQAHGRVQAQLWCRRSAHAQGQLDVVLIYQVFHQLGAPREDGCSHHNPRSLVYSLGCDSREEPWAVRKQPSPWARSRSCWHGVHGCGLIKKEPSLPGTGRRRSRLGWGPGGPSRAGLANPRLFRGVQSPLPRRRRYAKLHQ